MGIEFICNHHSSEALSPVSGCSALLLPSSRNVDVLPDGVGDLCPGGEDVPHVRGGLPAAGDLAGQLRGARGRPLQVRGGFPRLGRLVVKFFPYHQYPGTRVVSSKRGSVVP